MPILYLINAEQLCVAYSPRPDEVMIVRYVQPLTEEQRALLEKTMKDDASFRARTRAHSLLLSNQGTTIKEIAKAYQVDRDTVSSWLHIAPCGRTLQPSPLDQGPARGALEAYVPRLITSPSS